MAHHNFYRNPSDKIRAHYSVNVNHFELSCLGIFIATLMNTLFTQKHLQKVVLKIFEKALSNTTFGLHFFTYSYQNDKFLIRSHQSH